MESVEQKDGDGISGSNSIGAMVMNALQRYDKIAGLNGWLPIGISRNPTVSPHTVRDAANRCEALFPELATELRNWAYNRAAERYGITVEMDTAR